MKLSRSLFLLLFVCSGVSLALDRLPDAEALRVLERVARAPSQTAFQGVYVQQHGEYMETIRICRVVDGGVIQERREALDGPPREMLRVGDQISLFLPENALTKNFDPRSSSRLFPRFLPDNPAEVLQNYALSRVARERVVGMEAEVFELEPRDRLRYPHRLWVHVDSGLLLKTTTLGLRREILDLYAFSQLALGSQVDRNQLKPIYPVRPVSSDVGEVPVVAGIQWEIKGAPTGFRLIQQSQRAMPGRNQRVVQHVYSDGVATISVFLESMRQGMPVGTARQGALNVFGRQDGAYHILALGEVPAETVELFAKSYKPIEKQVKK